MADTRTLLADATDLHRRGRLAEAEALYRRVVAAEPRNADALQFLALALAGTGRAVEAAALLERAVATNPRHVPALINHGVVLHGLGRFADAIASFDRALALESAIPEALCNRGLALRELGRLPEALASFDRALALRPDDPEALASRGAVLLELRRPAEALASLERALARGPASPATLNNLGNALKALRRLDDALGAFDRAIALKPGFADAVYNRANALVELKRFADAVAAYDRALALDANRIDALTHRAGALTELGLPDEAAASYAGALALPAAGAKDRALQDEAVAQRALALRMTCDWELLPAAEAALLARARDESSVVHPYPLLSIVGDPALHGACARRFWAARRTTPPPAPSPRTAPVGDRIRLGYLSAELRQHSVMSVMADLFEAHDRRRFEVRAYSLGRDDGSPMRRRLEAAFDSFADVRASTDAEIAARIAADGVDVLVDLTGHTQDNRLAILERRPAPVTAHYIGYPGTLGCEFVDYAIVDDFVVRPGEEAHFTEQLVFLPDTYQVNAARDVAECTPTRAECGLPEDGFVFCSFNNSFKLSPATFDVWMRLLLAVPRSVLWIFAGSDRAAANLAREAARRGVDPERLVLAPHVPLDEHLARHRLADLFLDTLPYNAHATASHALWTGLPVLTCPGGAWPGRVAGSLLRAIEMPELIAGSVEKYEALALRLAREPATLAALRAKLAAKRASAPLFDFDRFRRNIETAYATMHDIARRGERPRSFAV